MADSPKVPLTNKPGVSNWVEKFRALPKGSWIRRAAEHMKGKGLPEKLAIPFAVKAAERICSSGDTNLPGLQQVAPAKRADACAALAVWKAAAVRAKASDLTARAELRVIDLAAAYIDHAEFGNPYLPRGATEAYIDLSEPDDNAIDLAFHPDQPRGFNGRWVAMSGKLKSLASKHDVFLSEHQHDTIAAHALAHGEPKEVSRGIGGNVIVRFDNKQLHSYGQHGGSERLDNLPSSGGAEPPLSSAERQAIVAEEILRAKRAIEPNIPAANGAPRSYSGGQLAAIKGIARKRAMERIDDEERRRAMRAERRAGLPKRVNRPAMTLTEVRAAALLDLSELR